MKRNLYFFISLIVLSFFAYHTFDFKIDASSDTLVSQNDKDFIFFNEYNKIFESKNFLVLAIKGKEEIDKNLLTEIDNISKKLKKLKGIENTFSINDAPILFINNSSLQELSSQNIRDNLYKNQLILKSFPKHLYKFSDSVYSLLSAVCYHVSLMSDSQAKQLFNKINGQKR